MRIGAIWSVALAGPAGFALGLSILTAVAALYQVEISTRWWFFLLWLLAWTFPLGLLSAWLARRSQTAVPWIILPLAGAGAGVVVPFLYIILLLATYQGGE